MNLDDRSKIAILTILWIKSIVDNKLVISVKNLLLYNFFHNVTFIILGKN